MKPTNSSVWLPLLPSSLSCTVKYIWDLSPFDGNMLQNLLNSAVQL